MPKPPETVPPVSPDTVVIVQSSGQDALLRRCLAALEASAERNSFEVVCVENGAVGGGTALEAEFPAVKFLRLPRYFGRTKGWNIGLRNGESEFVLFLEPESIVAPESLPALRAVLKARADAAAVCPLLVDEEGAPVPEIGPLPDRFSLWEGWRALRLPSLPEPPDYTGEPVAVPYASLAALLVRRNFLKGIRYFDEAYGEYLAEADLAVQVRRASRNILLLPAVRVTRLPTSPPDADEPRTGNLLAADYLRAARILVGKHYGWFKGVRFQAISLLAALIRLRVALLVNLLGDRKIDGSQTEF